MPAKQIVATVALNPLVLQKKWIVNIYIFVPKESR